jgi:predicted dehydrogenase
VTQAASSVLDVFTDSRPRLGFIGAGWIGGHRLKAIAQSGVAEIAGVFDRDTQAAAAAARLAGGAPLVSSWEALLEQNLSAVVIATPTALHAEQSIAALEAGLAVLCQKPLAVTSEAAHRVIAAAGRADRLLAVDMSYRFVRAVACVKQMIASGAIGTIFAADLIFHNAYGPCVGRRRLRDRSGRSFN